MKTQWTKRSRPGPIFDPYYDWAVSTKFAYYGKAEWLPVLIELHKPKAQEFAQKVFSMRQQSWASLIRIPPSYRTPPKRLVGPMRFLTALVRKEFLERVYRGEDPSRDIKRFALGRRVDLPRNLNAGSANTGWGSGKPKDRDVAPGVAVIGVIDDGIAFAHDRFRDGTTSTRIHYFWDQMVPSPLPGDWDYGRELCKHDTAVDGIDRRLNACRHGSVVDEDELYAAAGFLDYSLPGHKPLARRATHGTHVMDLSCNPATDPGIGPLIAVQLPSAIVEDTSLAGLAPQVLDALMYMLDRADKIAASNGVPYLPLVVNLSYGMVAGPHDGTGAIERVIEDVLDSVNTDPQKPLLRVVLPAGNTLLTRGHARFTLETKDPPFDLHWRVQPDDWTESFLEIWYPAKDSSNSATDLLVTISSPAGDVLGPFDETTGYAWTTATGVLAQIDFYPAVAPGTRKLIKISLAPTGSAGPAPALAPAGLWRVSVTNNGKGRVKDIHAWIQRDDTPHGYPRRGRQSYFDDDQYHRFDDGGRWIESDEHPLTKKSYVKREGTLNAIATGSKSIVVAGLRRSDWKPARYSASGPAVPPARGAPNPRGPEAMRPSDDTPSHHGLLAAGSRSGSCVALYGTSVAAPQTTHWVAGNLAAAGPGDRKSVGDFTQANVPPPDYTEKAPPPGAASKPPDERTGKGRIDLRLPRLPRFER